ncbi:MAG: hypothetical protein GEV28_35145 [Actinophytocola sp.]|uniref:hypothetical protein n=1 Tax=Actinophytocola sp. TaxID=1872138 RepID=UPI001326B2D0|nr:hypothetical protein [Actinophytocola sp.]MPZ85343.1 hypothetical protein [Actinophytocola sp.]
MNAGRWAAVIALGAVLLGSSYLIGSTAGLLAGSVLVAILVVLGARATLSEPNRTADTPPGTTARRPAFPTFRRLAVTVGWAGTSWHAWDRDVRPALVRLVDVVLADRYGTDLTRRPELGARLLGESLWPLVDPNRPRSDDRDTPGPSRHTLERILTRLETHLEGTAP